LAYAGFRLHQENLQEEFNALMRKLGLPEALVPFYNYAVQPLSPELLTEAQRARLQQVYLSDFKRFGYKLETVEVPV